MSALIINRKCMKGTVFSILCLAAFSGAAHAQDCPDVAPYQKAREVIADLGDIVSPNGVQETYKTRIGGIDQWITIRGQDRANPIVLFVHGGPASPLTPTLWQFQRPLEEYFTMATLRAPEYSAADVCAIDNGNLFTLDRIMPEFQAVDFKSVGSFPIPVVMLMGRHDYTTPQQPTADWLAKVSAPSKHGIWFEHSSHMVPWEEPGKMLVTLLEYVRPLATAARK